MSLMRYTWIYISPLVVRVLRHIYTDESAEQTLRDKDYSLVQREVPRAEDGYEESVYTGTIG